MAERMGRMSRRRFLKGVVGGAGLALAGPAVQAFANRHPHPHPQSLPHLDRAMYLHNMEVIAHFLPGEDRGQKMQMMAIGARRLLFQRGDVIDVTHPQAPRMFNKGGFQGGQLQLAYNKTLRKWILITGSAPPPTSATPTAPNGKYDDPSLIARVKAFRGLRGIRIYDATDPSRIVKLSEFSTGATGGGTHRNYYDGGRYAYLDASPDETFTHMESGYRYWTNGLMVVDVSDPANPKQVSLWWVPGQRAGEEEAYRGWPEFGDKRGFTTLHGPVYVPKRVEDGGTRGYGAWGAFGFLIHDLSDVTRPRLVGRFDPSPPYDGGIPFHTVWLGMLERHLVLTNPEPLNPDCNEPFLRTWVIDIRDETNPVPIATLPRPAPPPNAPYTDFCFKRGRFGTHNPPHLKAPGRPPLTFVCYAYFNAGLRCYDLTNPYRPEEVAYFIPPQGGDLHEFASYNRTVDNAFVEWDRRVMYVASDTGIYVVSTPALGKPVLEPRPVAEWSLPKLNDGAP